MMKRLSEFENIEYAIVSFIEGYEKETDKKVFNKIHKFCINREVIENGEVKCLKYKFGDLKKTY